MRQQRVELADLIAIQLLESLGHLTVQLAAPSNQQGGIRGFLSQDVLETVRALGGRAELSDQVDTLGTAQLLVHAGIGSGHALQDPSEESTADHRGRLKGEARVPETVDAGDDQLLQGVGEL